MNKNRKILNSFIAYCNAYPDQRFWQALRNWSVFEFIYVAKFSDGDFTDTFYFEGKDK